MNQQRFVLGRIVATPGAVEALAASGDDPFVYIGRHAAGDWGEICAEDARENDLSVKLGFRILSVYRLSDSTKLWLITEADRSATTLLLPAEY